MRGILIDWIVDVHRKFKLKTETLFLAVSLIDRICALTPIAKHRFQLLGITGLFVASKYEEIYPPYLSDFAFVCAEAYSESDILSMEAEILRLLDFSLVGTSTLVLVESYVAESKCISLTFRATGSQGAQPSTVCASFATTELGVRHSSVERACGCVGFSCEENPKIAR